MNVTDSKPTFRERIREGAARFEAERDAHKFDAAFAGWRVNGDRLFKGFTDKAPIAGVEAEFSFGAPSARFTATRIALMGPFALAFKKDKTKCYVYLAFPDGDFEILEGKAKKDEPTARKFAASVNAAAARAAADTA